MSEHDQQVTLFELIELDTRRWPDLEMLFAIPNAGAGAQKGQAGKMKAEGAQSGVPDMLLAEPRGTYHGLFIEMKEPGKDTSTEQKDWIARLIARGYLVKVCFSCDEARAVLLDYIKLPTTKVVTERVWHEVLHQPPQPPLPPGSKRPVLDLIQRS